MKILMQGDRTHGRPHVHIEYGGNCRMAARAIDTGEHLADGLDSKYDNPVHDWIGRKRKKLDRTWRALTNGHNPKKLVAQLRNAA